jgi:ribosomal-protein-alanine N-acetyltransferase
MKTRCNKIDTSVIETTRLVLRKVCIEDAVDIHAYVQNPNVLRYTTGIPPQKFAETESFVQGLANKSSGDFAWAIRQKGALAVIGVIELSLDDNLSGSVDYALAQEYWNQGIMTEVLRAVLDWAFRTYTTLESVSSSAMTANPSSTRVQQKCGMKLLRTEYQTWSKFDEPVELAICSISRDAWAVGNHS